MYGRDPFASPQVYNSSLSFPPFPPSPQVYNSYISKVHGATRLLTSLPSTVEEFADFLEFLAQVETQKAEIDKEYDLVGGWGQAACNHI